MKELNGEETVGLKTPDARSVFFFFVARKIVVVCCAVAGVQTAELQGYENLPTCPLALARRNLFEGILVIRRRRKAITRTESKQGYVLG